MLSLIVSLVLALPAPALGAAPSQDADAGAWAGVVELDAHTRLEFFVRLTRDAGTISIPEQNVQDLALSDVAVTEHTLVFALAEAGARWELSVAADGQSATGLLRQGGEYPTTLRRLPDTPTDVEQLVRPQLPSGPLPYDALDVAFENAAAELQLAGTLTLPRGEGPFPAVVLITGSGPQDRDESVAGHKPFLVLADHLTRAGVAVLRYDDRGVGASQGDFAGATTDDFASDALAAVEFLASRAELDPRRLGLIGHSEGGTIAPMCAARSTDVAFVVLLAGTGIPGVELIPLQTRLINVAEGLPEDEAARQAHELRDVLTLISTGRPDAEIGAAIRAAAMRQLRELPELDALPDSERDAIAAQVVAEQLDTLTTPWFRRFLALDPREALGALRCPVLALNGAKDLQVPARENLGAIREALASAGNNAVTIRELPGLNHLFQTCETGTPSEYAEIEESFAPLALEVLTSWILELPPPARTDEP